jgi:hypothetical protein
MPGFLMASHEEGNDACCLYETYCDEVQRRLANGTEFHS